MAENDSIKDLTLEDYDRKTIINALLIGLDSYGEIERLDNAVEVLKICNTEIPESLRPIHPTGSADTVGIFAMH